MKKIIIITVILFSPYLGKCQGYKSIFGQDSTTWNIVKEVIDGVMTFSFQTKNGFDSTLNSHNYKIVSDHTFIVGLLREDTITGKAWYYSRYSQKESCIMDLSLQLNDTFIIYQNSTDSIATKVDSVYYSNGLKHVRLNFFILAFNNNNNTKIEFIESIGANSGITYQCESNGWNSISEQLLCKYNDTTQVYTNTDYNGACFVQWGGIDELSDHIRGIISPNPLTSSSILQLNTQLKNADVVIYDMLGKEMVRKRMDGDGMEIEKGSLESGVYFVRVRSEESEWVGKMVVE